MRSIGWIRVAMCVCAAAVSAQSQAELKVMNGGAGDMHFGWANSGLDDIDMDGFPDLIVGAPDFNYLDLEDAGLVRVYSGKELQILWEGTGLATGDRYGQFVADAGDVNQDGWPDFLVGAIAAQGPKGEPDVGSAELRSGQDFSLIYKWYGDSAFDDFGECLAPVGDVNADGWIDIVAGGRRHDGNGTSSGIARVFSGFDGSVLYDFYGDGPGWLAGSAAAAAGDFNEDGYDDVIVGCRGASPEGLTKAGQAVIYSGFDGAVLLTLNGRHAGDGLGSGVACVGDVNMDGTVDYAIGVWQSNELGPVTGSAIVLSGASELPLYTWIGEHSGAVMGVWVDSAGDANRDGWPDIAVGAEGTHAGFELFHAGKVYVYSGKDGSKIYEAHGEGPGDRLGTVVANASDVNQDGYDDMISGAYWNDFGGHDAGTARVYSGCANVWSQTGTALPGGNGEPHLAACGVMAGNDPVTLKLINAASNTHTALLVGLNAINLPFHGGVVVPDPQIMLFGLTTNAVGTLELDGTWPNGIPSGIDVYIQYLVPDALGTDGWSASNAVIASTP